MSTLLMKQVGSIILFVICGLAGNDALAQTLAASPYSYYGVGSLFRKGSGHNRSLGGTGIGLREGYAINNLNPASYTAIALPFSQLTEIGLMVTVGQQQEGSRRESEVELDFPGMALWFRLNDHWMSAVGLTPYSNVDYHIEEEASFIGLNSEYTTVYTGSGGLSQVYFGLARKWWNQVSVGAHLSYIFGPLTSEQDITASSLSNWQIYQNTYLHTFTLDVGVQYSLQWENAALTLGSTLNLGSRLKGTYTYQVLQSEEVIEEEETAADDYILPASAGFGISWSRNQQWRLSADVSADQWSKATFEQGYQLRDARRFSVGAEILPDPRALSYLRRVGFSVGAFHEENYLTLSGGEIETKGITAGIKLPTNGVALFHLTLEHSLNGNKDLIIQRYTQLSCNISFFDVWFVKRKQE